MNTKQKNCKVCNSVFYPLVAEINRGRGITCSRVCRYKRHSKLMLGHVFSLESRKKLSNSLTGRKRSRSHSDNISKSLIGKRVGNLNGNWRGGVYKSQGRWYIRDTSHPHKHHNGYILNSHYVAEQILGRYITRKERIHHMNLDKGDDRPENLYLFDSNSAHTTYHHLLESGKKSIITESNLSSY